MLDIPAEPFRSETDDPEKPLVVLLRAVTDGRLHNVVASLERGTGDAPYGNLWYVTGAKQSRTWGELLDDLFGGRKVLSVTVHRAESWSFL